MVVLAFESLLDDEVIKCDHSNENYCQQFPVVLFVALYKVAITFESLYPL